MAARITRKDVVEALPKQHDLPKSQADTLVLELLVSRNPVMCHHRLDLPESDSVVADQRVKH